MSSPHVPQSTVCFGEFTAELEERELFRNGSKVRLQGQPFEILAVLLEHPGRLVTRDELRQRLWPSDTFVDFEHGLNAAVNRLREALDDSAEEPRFIETLPRRGYRFIAAIDRAAVAVAQTVPERRHDRGFSKKSGEPSRVWGKKISADYNTDARITYFVVPVLQDAPSLVRPMILHGMRKTVPAQELPHFVPLYSNESDWKRIVNFSAPDDAYLIVATPDAHPIWQAHGAYSDDM